MNLLRFMITNGGRPLALSASAAILSLAGLVGVILIANFWPEPSLYAPLGGYNIPQDVEKHTVYAGGSIIVTVTKCNLSGEDINVVGEAHWRRVSDGGEEVVTGMTGSKEFGPGCLTRTFENNLPPELGPGLWILEGTDSTFRGDERQDVTWRTEAFRVIS